MDRGEKRHHSHYDNDQAQKRRREGIGPVVAKHYNELEERGIEARSFSDIFHMRNFNNWVKSTLVSDVIQRMNRPRYSLTVLDMCCGKGGDIQKWIKSNAVRHVIFADIAGTSVEQCEERYNTSRRYQGSNIFNAEFITADCTKERLRGRYQNPGMPIDLVSIQFGFHYSFETLAQAQMILKNVSENLVIDGYFVGTIPNANRIVKQFQEAGCKTFGNEIYTINIEATEPLPLFGAKYTFQLDEVVNCPEFLVHFPCFVELARREGLKLVFHKNFDEYFDEKKEEGEFLLNRMQALNKYPSGEEQAPDEDYAHAAKFLDDNPEFGTVGTLPKSQWDAICLYTVFCFQKVKV